MISQVLWIKCVSSYKSIVDKILQSHNGPIREFSLFVPYFFRDEQALEPNAIDAWIFSVSQCGVQDLKLELENMADYRVPSSLFQCTELRHLSLTFDHFELPPHHFRKFSLLTSLELNCGILSGDVLTDIILSCPLVERLWLNCYLLAEYGPFMISAPKLKLLYVEYCGNLYFFLKNTPNISRFTVHRMEPMGGADYEMNGYENILEFFGAVPKVEEIEFDGEFLSEWDVQHVPERTQTTLYHRSLVVRHLDLHSPAQLHSLFLFIKSSPKLKSIDIWVYKPVLELQDRLDSRYYLRSRVRDAENLQSLRTVKLSDLLGEEPEIIFIEIILSWCPILEKLYLNSKLYIKPEAELKMMTDIMRFRRASTRAEVIYSKG